MPNDEKNESEIKPIVTFQVSKPMYDFLKEQAGEETLAVLLRGWIREKMAVASPEPVTA